MKNKFKLLIILALSILLVSCTPTEQGVGKEDISAAANTDGAVLEKSPDMGEEYIDSLIFFGESTTYHLKSRGVLSGGKDTKQVWAPKSGTVNLDATISALKIVYPETGKEITLSEAISQKKPKIMVLTFGLNGAVQKHGKGEKYFSECYMRLINIIRQGSPDTKIILQSCFPIASTMDMSNYSVDAATLNSYITQINLWTRQIAADAGCYYLNTCEELSDGEGFLREEFDVGDGHHLTAAAYEVMLEYIKTHGIKEYV